MGRTHLNGNDRRKEILARIEQSSEPVSAGVLGREQGVSRQVIVQDIALLRSEGHDIIATARGYTPGTSPAHRRLIKVRHTNEESERELTLIVDLGGCVEDVIVNHHIYGQMSATLNIKSRRDVRQFTEDIKSGKSSPLMNITSGYHFHHISAESDEILDEIESALKENHFTAEIFPYEKEL